MKLNLVLTSSLSNEIRGRDLRFLVFDSLNKTACKVLFALAGYLAFSFCPCLAQWSTDPTQNPIVGYGLNPELCSDSAGGCYVTYEQDLGYPRRLVLERINKYGYKAWTTPAMIEGGLPEQLYARITEDGRGGVIAAFSDDSISEFGGTFRVRVQRVDSSGNSLWGPIGVRASLSETNQDQQAIVPDGRGGCIVAWVDTLGALRINRIDSTGARMWGDSGRYVWNSPARPPMVSDRNGGCVLVYGIGRLQRYGAAGNPYWPPAGILIPTAAIEIALDEDLNAHLLGQKVLADPSRSTLNLQKLSVAGDLLWDSLGVVIDTIDTFTLRGVGLDLQHRYSTTAWIDETGGHDELWTQVVREDGSTIFPSGGEQVSSVPSSKVLVGVLPSDSSTVLFIWTDSRTPSGIYAQRLDTLAYPLWNSNDVAVSIPPLSVVKLTSDGSGGAIIAGSGDSFSIRLVQLSRYGNLGQVITSVRESWVDGLPDHVVLNQSFPNPFNAGTMISYSLPSRLYVTLDVYDIIGRRVKMLVREVQGPGAYRISLEASDLPSGVYFYRLQAGDFVQTRKMLLLK